MKKVISALLCAVIFIAAIGIFAGCACSHEWKNGKCIHCNEECQHEWNEDKCSICQLVNPQKDLEYASAKNAYECMSEVNELCVEIMDSIYNAWYFAIYKADDYTLSNRLLLFEIYTGLNTSGAVEALSKDLGYEDSSINGCIFVSNINTAVALAQKVYELNGNSDTIDNKLKTAQAEIKKLSNTYADITGFPTLKSYYSELSSYWEFCNSPNCSFSQLSGRIDTYESNLSRYKQDLAFCFE